VGVWTTGWRNGWVEGALHNPRGAGRLPRADKHRRDGVSNKRNLSSELAWSPTRSFGLCVLLLAGVVLAQFVNHGSCTGEQVGVLRHARWLGLLGVLLLGKQVLAQQRVG
jgi:hypothetical protein